MDNIIHRGSGLNGLLAAAMMAMSQPYVLEHDPYEELREIRRRIPAKRKVAYRPRYRRATKTTHRRNRVKVAASRRANVQRLRQSRRPS